MNAKHLTITAAALSTLVLLGVASSTSAEFKHGATTVCIVLLGLISLGGIAAPILRLFDVPPAERASAARTTTRSTQHTGAHR